MRPESSLDRSLWTIAVAVVVALVIANFAQRPLFGGDGEASGFGAPLTLWVTGGEAEGQTRSVARQVAACWSLTGRQASVGVLTGSTVSAVVDFLRSAHNPPDELLVLTSTTLADIAHDERAPAGSEEHERAQQAVRLLADAPTVRVLGTDPLSLGVRKGSPLRDSAEVLARIRGRPAEPFIGVSEDDWLRSNLAELAQSAGLNGQLPFDAYGSSRLAITSLLAGEAGVVLARRSALAANVAAGQVRMLGWSSGTPPRAWVALLAPRGLDAAEMATMRHQADGLCAGGAWRGLLHADGLSPTDTHAAPTPSFIRDGLLEAARGQALAARIVRNY